MNFIKNVKRNVNLPVRRIRKDNGMKFINLTLIEFLVSKSIEHNLHAPYTPQKNGVVERHNITLAEATHSMLNFAYL